MNTIVVAAAGVFLAGALLASREVVRGRRGDPRSESTGVTVSALLGLGPLAIAVWFVQCWTRDGHPPMHGQPETLVLLAGCASLLYLLLGRVTPRPSFDAVAATLFSVLLVRALVLPGPGDGRELPAALESPWFVFHVAAYFLGYGALLVAAVAAVFVLASREGPGSAEDPGGAGDVMHRGVLVGFPLITAGMVLGAIWAQEAWGDYWAWDPKEAAALTTWLIYALYFHLRLLPGWTRRHAAWLTLAGFTTAMTAYLWAPLIPGLASSVHLH